MSGASRARPRVFTVVLALTALTCVTVTGWTWGESTGQLSAYWSHSAPPGQLAYVVSKLLGLWALVSLCLQLMAALLRSLGWLRMSSRAHILLGLVAVSCMGGHVAVFLLASQLRTGHAALGLLAPRFDLGFYRSSQSLGAIALWLVVLAVGAGVRRLRARGVSRWLHRSVFAAFGLALAHAGAVGSETRMTLVATACFVLGLSVAVLIARSLVGRTKRVEAREEAVSSDAI